MEKKTKKISINLTQEEFNLIQALANIERRTISELSALILVDNAQQLFLNRQGKGEMKIAHFTPHEYDL